MANQNLANFLLLPELKLNAKFNLNYWGIGLKAEKFSDFEVCPKCATPSKSVYDRRYIKVKDEPIRGKAVVLHLQKRRFYCKPCRKPFTEPIKGISKGHRTTQRFKRSLCWAATKFSSLKDVQKAYRCSARMVYQSYYEQLELRQRKHTYDVPKKIGIDEHSLRKLKYRAVEYATIIVDHKNKRVYDLIDGRTVAELKHQTAHMKGFENVEVATLDLSPTYRSFLKQKNPNVTLVADRFHVQRLFTKLVNKFRLQVTGDKRKPRINKILLRDGSKLDWDVRRAVYQWLNEHPKLREMYQLKEAMHRFYRIRGLAKATKALQMIIDRMGQTKTREIKELRKVLLSWRKEILNYFKGRYTNGRTEGFNRKAKLIQRKAYGIKSFKNYRLRLLNECW